MFVCNGDCSSATSTGSGGSSVSSGVSNEIVLRNIQYIPQQIHIGVSHDGAIRHGTIILMNSTEVANWEAYKNNVIYNEVSKDSNRYCGLASALMVRSKAQRYSTLAKDDETVINNGLTDMAFGLVQGRYGGPNEYKIDVVESGLLYIRSDWWSKLYDQPRL